MAKRLIKRSSHTGYKGMAKIANEANRKIKTMKDEINKEIQIEGENKITQDADVVKQLILTSSGINEFTQKVGSIIVPESNDELLGYIDRLAMYLDLDKTKVAGETSFKHWEISGGGNITTYMKQEALEYFSSRSFGMYVPDTNIIIVPANKDALQNFKVKTNAYGIDAVFIRENLISAFALTYFHECLHAILSNNDGFIEKVPEVSTFMTVISQAAKMNKLTYLEPILAHWQEIITHLLSNKDYFNYIKTNSYQFELSKIILKAISDNDTRKLIVDFINSFTKQFHNEKIDIVYYIDDYSDKENFLSREFYSKYPHKILGTEFESTNKWGKPVFKTKKFSKDHELQNIFDNVTDLPIIDFSAFDNLGRVDSYADNVEINTAKSKVQKSIDKLKSKSKEVAKLDTEFRDIISFRESVIKYNKSLTKIEIEAFLYCYPGENKHIWIDASEYSEEQLLASRSDITINKGFTNECSINIFTIIFDGEKNNFFSLFLHGDIHNKIQLIKNKSNEIADKRGKEYYEQLIKDFESIKAVSVSFDNEDYGLRPYISPSSDMAINFKIVTFEGDSRTYKDNNIGLTEAFIIALGSEWYKASRYNGVKYTDIIRVIKGQRLVERLYKGKDLTDIEKQKNDEADMNNSREFDNAFQSAIMAFSDFIKDAIDEESRNKLLEDLNGFQNKFSFTDLDKVPVGFTHSGRFKNLNHFELSKSQRDAVAFLNINKTGLLAYGVGVGKTLSALMCISNRFDTNNANKSLVIVPTPVYDKWIKDASNHVQKVIIKGKEEEIQMYGCVNHLNIVGLGNLNDEIIKSLKEYTDAELKLISDAESGFEWFDKEIHKLIEEKVTGEEEPEAELPPQIQSPESGIASKEIEDEKDTRFLVFKSGDAETLKKFNEILKKVDLAAFRIFGITNRENATGEVIYKQIMEMNANGNLLPQIENIYEALKAPKDITKAEQLTHLSVIANIVYKSYKTLPSFYIMTLGKLKEFSDKTIFFASYSALSRFGFKDETIRTMAENMLQIFEGDSDESDKDSENIESLLGKISFIQSSTLNARIYFEDFGFDYLVVDEAHNLKNLITKVTKSSEQKDSQFQGNISMMQDIKGGKLSNRAIIGFMISMYIQDKNHGRNVCLLTATPFTNSPLEIYSILTLTSHTYLKKLGYPNVKKFVDDFIKLKTQLSVAVDGSIKIKTEPVGFNNLNLMKRMIFTLISFMDAEESNIKRPCKITLPLKEKSTLCDSHDAYSFTVIKPIPTIVQPSKEQQLIFDALQMYLSDQVNKKTVDSVFNSYIKRQGEEYIKKVMYPDVENISTYEDEVRDLFALIKEDFNFIGKQGKTVDKLFEGVAILKVLMAMRNVSITPYMFRNFTKLRGIADQDIKPKDVVESSGKLLYTLGCISSSNEYQDKLGKPRKGFVIYSNLGTNVGKNSPISMIKMLKSYMLDESSNLGYKAKAIKDPESVKVYYDEVELLIGSTSAKRRVTMMKLFNEGQIKVIITTVKEGVDLQGNTFAGFNLSVDWNPTDAQQIAGRWWRQGNKNAYCLVAYPLTANSSDVAIYQKLQDKTVRIKAITDRTNVKSQFDLGEFNPEEMKIGMISRVDKLASFMYNDEMNSIKLEYRLLKSRYEEETNIIKMYKDFNSQSYKIRWALHFLTRIPVILDKTMKLNELKTKSDESLRVIEELKNDIKDIVKQTSSYSKIQAIDSDIAKADGEMKSLASKAGEAMISGDAAGINEIQGKISVIKANIDSLNKQKSKLENLVKDEIKDKTKDIEDDIKKVQKELDTYTKKIEVLNANEIMIFDKSDKFSINPVNDFLRGNYFIPSESDPKKYVYSEKGLSLDVIDWVNKATILDLLEGCTRVYEAYDKNTQFRNAIDEWPDSSINFNNINDQYGLFPFGTTNIIVELKDFMNSSGYIYKNKIISIVTNFETDRNGRQSYFNIFMVKNMRNSINRSLKEYNSILDGQEPEEYLNKMAEKINEMQAAVGSDSLTSIPDITIEKYIDKALTEIKKRRKEYTNFVNLVDAYSGLNELMNIELMQIIKEKTGEKEQTKALVIKPTENGDKEAISQKQMYLDKIEVYEEMIASTKKKSEKQKYIDKIEVYKEMLNEL